MRSQVDAIAEPSAGHRREGRPLPLLWTLLLAALVTAATTYGLLVEDAYRSVSGMTRQTWRAQDAVTLAAVPLLLGAARRARAGSLPAHVAELGILIWLTYCYAHLAIGTPFNAMFLVYVAVLGLAGFAMLDGILRVDVRALAPASDRGPRRAASGFLAVAGTGIAGLWLSEILPALPDGLPTNVHLAELPNPTWVLDLAWIIPLSIGAAVLLRRRHPAAWLVAGSLLVMLLILSAGMLAIVPFALAAGLQSDPAIAAQLGPFSILFGLFAACEAWLLVGARRSMGVVGPAWRRPGWWT